MPYKDDDQKWEDYKSKYKGSYISDYQFDTADKIIELVREQARLAGTILPLMQGYLSSSDEDDDDFESGFVVSWGTVRVNGLYIEVLRNNILRWSYMDFPTQKYEWKEWDFSENPTLPKEVIHYISLLKRGENSYYINIGDKKYVEAFISYDRETNSYIGVVPELDNTSSHGPTYSECMERTTEAVRGRIEALNKLELNILETANKGEESDV